VSRKKAIVFYSYPIVKYCTFPGSGLYMVHLRMKYFQKQKNMYLWGRGIALVKEDVLKMLEFFEEALLLCQVDKDETKKFLVLMADFIEYSREWTNSDAVDLADVVDDFFVNGATIKDLLSSKAKITEPYELYKAVNEVKAHKDTLMCILLTRLCNHTFATVEAKESGGYVEIYETDRIALKRTRRQQGESAAVLQRARADASEVFANDVDFSEESGQRIHSQSAQDLIGTQEFALEDRIVRASFERAPPQEGPSSSNSGEGGEKRKEDAFRHYGSSSRGQRSQEKEKV
jgi:hypothetical protein